MLLKIREFNPTRILVDSFFMSSLEGGGTILAGTSKNGYFLKSDLMDLDQQKAFSPLRQTVTNKEDWCGRIM